MISGRSVFAIAASAALFLLLATALLPSIESGVPMPTVPTWLGDALWSDRALDLVIQSFLLLTGVLAILLLLRDESPEARHA